MYNCPKCGASMRRANRQVDAVLKAAPPAPEGVTLVGGSGRGEQMPQVVYRDAQGRLHNPDGPAETFYNLDGTLSSEDWLTHGIPHRLDGPSETVCDDKGRTVKERYFIDGLAHRLDGPASIDYDQDGTPIREVWQYRGEEMSALRRHAPEFGISRDNDAAIDLLEGLPLRDLSPQHPAVVLARQLFPNA